MFLTTQDIDMLESSVQLMAKLYADLRDIPLEEARRKLPDLDKRMKRMYKRKDDKDTEYIDIFAENMIAGGRNDSGHVNLMRDIYDKEGVVVTEEAGKYPRNIMIGNETPVIISDPVDGSDYFDKIAQRFSDSKYVGNAFDAELKNMGEKTKRHACNSSLTLIKDNMLKYSIIMNLITGDIYVASPLGVYTGNSNNVKGIGDINKPIDFIKDNGLDIACYTKTAKHKFNFEGTRLSDFNLNEEKINELSDDTGIVGPMRFTYLVDYGNGSDVQVIGYNGEKIQESLPTVAVAEYSGSRLQAYKMFCERNFLQHKSDVIFTPNLRNSLYSGRILNHGIKVDFLNLHDYPSYFRDSLAIIPSSMILQVLCLKELLERNRQFR